MQNMVFLVMLDSLNQSQIEKGRETKTKGKTQPHNKQKLSAQKSKEKGSLGARMEVFLFKEGTVVP